MDQEQRALTPARGAEAEPGTRRRRRLRGAEAPGHPAVVLVAENQQLQDEVARLGAAAGVEITVAGSIASALALAPEVLLLSGGHAGFGAGPQATPGMLPALGKTEVIVVGLAGDPDTWDAAAGSSAARVAVLPAAAAWLAGYLGRRRSSPGGQVIGVLAGCGGAGASTLACWLSARAADSGESVLLLEGEPWGPGLEWILGADGVEGIRWPDLAGLSGSLNPVQLAANLPALGGFSLLARGDGEPSLDEPVLREVVDAARTGYGLTVVDVGRQLGAGSLLPFCDQLLLIVPGRSGGVPAARTVLPYLGPAPVAVVVRGPLSEGLDELRIADALNQPLAGYLPFVHGAERAADAGRVLSALRRAGARKAADRILARTLAVPDGLSA